MGEFGTGKIGTKKQETSTRGRRPCQRWLFDVGRRPGEEGGGAGSVRIEEQLQIGASEEIGFFFEGPTLIEGAVVASLEQLDALENYVDWRLRMCS